jgi:hypothetical protein
MGVQVIRAQLVAIYSRHNPHRLEGLDALLEEWQGGEAELLAAVLQRYPDMDTAQEKLSRRVQAAKSVHLMQQHSSTFGQFGKPPSLQNNLATQLNPDQKAVEERKQNIQGVVEALRTAPSSRSSEHEQTVLAWAAKVEFFQQEIKSDQLRQECCKALQLVELKAGEVLYRQGDLGDSLDCVLTGAISVLEGDTEVAVLHRPATFGERSLEVADGLRTGTCVSKTGGTLARMSAVMYRACVKSHREKRLSHLQALEQEDAAIEAKQKEQVGHHSWSFLCPGTSCVAPMYLMHSGYESTRAYLSSILYMHTLHATPSILT